MENKLIELLKKEIADKKVLILGFGREGRLNLETVLRAGSAKEVAVADRNEVDVQGIRSVTGDSYLSCIDEFDIVLKSPGVVLPKPFDEYKAVITSQTEYFLKVYGNQTIGITGTKGKSTTTTLIYHELKENGFDALLLGNIGIPAFGLIDEIKEDTKIVFELSCHQLEYGKYSPYIGVYLNVFPEHLDHYGSFEKYRAAKENIYKNQKRGNRLYCGSGVIPREGETASTVTVIYDFNRDDKALEMDEHITTFVEKNFISYNNHTLGIDEDSIALKGFHNFFDIAVAFAVCSDLGVSEEGFVKALTDYKTLPHRLEFVGNIDGVKYYDDSISTIPATAIEAINTIKDTDTIIIGGMDRGIDYEPLIKYLETSSVPNIILMETTGARIREEIKMGYMELNNSERLHLVDNLSEAVKLAKAVTEKGKSCIMSPAAASYGIFKNFEERGEVFKKLVKER
ncbi:MAG: UDP-N-acetylmuramoyl-L-alanine--D-glutamate ligase [Catonella sp.]|uniref:UDP-N-acetylmuramoyl-L-alanine--D-glutamate ligase n=1 Tax=Catonella sp. TaxID=2382125 RepID=UPI003F9F717F